MMITFQLTTNVICKLMLIFAVVKLREQASPQQFEPARLRSGCAVLAMWRKDRHDKGSVMLFPAGKLRQLTCKDWKSKDVLPLVLIVMALPSTSHKGVNCFSNLSFRQSKAFQRIS